MIPRALLPASLVPALVAAAAVLSCGPERRESGPADERGPEFYAAALASLEQTPELLRRELVRGCDKWRHLDRECDPEEVRRDTLECWVDKGERIQQWVEARKLRPRAAAVRVLLEVNVCMELRRWRRLKPGPELKGGR